MAAIVARKYIVASSVAIFMRRVLPHLSASVRRSTHFAEAVATGHALQTSIVLYLAADHGSSVGKDVDTFMTLIERLENRREAMTVQEVAELLGVSDKHIYEMTADGTLPAFHVGRSVRLDPQDVADWLREKKPVPAKRAAEDGSPKHRVRTRDLNPKPGYEVLRGKVQHLEAAAAIERESR